MEAGKCIPVRVAVRCRPLIPNEQHEGCQVCVRFLDSCQVVLGVNKAFTFDHVFAPEDSQKFVYDTTVSKLIPEIFKGYNVTVLAYGQTGSGKTFSMGTSGNFTSLAADSDVGIIPRAVQDIFCGVQQKQEKVFTIKASFLEVYKEDILDLFSSRRQEPLSIREDSTGTIKIPNLSEVAVHNTEETLRLLESGAASRRTGATCMNAHSSRSHAIFTLTVEQQATGDENDTTVAKFHLVDLAGSERAGKTKAQGERLKEGININRGLLSLGNVISALCDESAHVPYRDSKLTRLLQDSLGGNSNTVMLACISPADSNFEETLNTLRYADRARKIKNKPVINRDPQAMELMRLKQLVQQLQAQLRSGGPEGVPKEMSTVDEQGGDNYVQTLLQQIRGLAEEKQRVTDDYEQLQEKYQQLHGNNEQLNSEMHALLDQLSSLAERHISDQMEIEQLRNLNRELQTKIESLQCAVNDEEKVEILKDIQKSLNEYKEDVKLRHQARELQSKHLPLADNGMDPGEETEDERCEEDVATAETNRTFRRAAMSRELDQLNKILQAKEELASTMAVSGNQLEVVLRQYEESKRQLESELEELKKERDELSHALLTAKSLSAPRGVSEQRRKRIKELEVRIAELGKQVQEQNRLIKMKEETERNARKLKEEIQAMKQTRVRLMRQLKEESGRHRQAQMEMDRKVRVLRLKERRQASALAKLERQSALRMSVLERRMNEALAAKHRLELAAARRRDWKKHCSEGGIEGLNSRIKTWLSEEVTLLTDSKKMEHHLQCLLDSRRMVAEQLREISVALEENPTAEDPDTLREKQKQLRKDLEEHNVQIGELQEKILDIDPDKLARNMFNGVTNTMECQAVSTCLLKMVTDRELQAYTLKTKQEETNRDVEDLRAALDDTKKKMEAMEKGFEMKVVELEKKHQEKMVYLLKYSTNVTINSNPDMDATLLDRYKAQECEISRLQNLHEELERKTQEVDLLQKELARAQTKSGKVWLEDVRLSAKKLKNLPPKAKAAKVEPVPIDLDWYNDLDETIENRENDPDWSLESELKRGTKRRSAEEKPHKTLKRSSSSMLHCKCRGPCQVKRCGCLGKGRKCAQTCACKGTCAAGTQMDDAPIAEEPLHKLQDNVQG